MTGTECDQNGESPLGAFISQLFFFKKIFVAHFGTSKSHLEEEDNYPESILLPDLLLLAPFRLKREIRDLQRRSPDFETELGPKVYISNGKENGASNQNRNFRDCQRILRHPQKDRSEDERDLGTAGKEVGSRSCQPILEGDLGNHEAGTQILKKREKRIDGGPKSVTFFWDIHGLSHVRRRHCLEVLEYLQIFCSE